MNDNPTYVKLREQVRSLLVTRMEPMDAHLMSGEVLDAIWPEINRLAGVDKLMLLYRDKLQEALRLLIPCVGRVDTTRFTDDDWTERAKRATLHYREPDEW